MTLVLVAGSYPPIPVPAAERTSEAVREEWDRGNDVIVASPRPSAAHYAVPITGWLAGRRLRRLRRLTGATRLVLCVEPGLPFAVPLHGVSAPGVSARRRTALSAARLARAIREFDHNTLIITAEMTEISPAVATLRAAADVVIEDICTGVAPPGVTALGPTEVLLRDRARWLVGKAGRALLGGRWESVRRSIAARLRHQGTRRAGG